jgi:peptide/nickel transport system permease protein
VVVGAGFAIVFVALALFAGSLAPHPPDEQNFDLIEATPGTQAPFGTDRFGRDVQSRVVYGARVSLYAALTSIGLAMRYRGAENGRSVSTRPL